jgi:hypothetical protein
MESKSLATASPKMKKFIYEEASLPGKGLIILSGVMDTG